MIDLIFYIYIGYGVGLWAQAWFDSVNDTNSPLRSLYDQKLYGSFLASSVAGLLLITLGWPLVLLFGSSSE